MKFIINSILSLIFLIIFLLLSTSCSEMVDNPDLVEEDVSFNYYYPVPKPEQLLWQEDKLAMFIHFGLNTFTDKEIGDGTESPQLFNPGKLDVNQWVLTAKGAGFKLVIITAKHVDGFCLWPSKYTEYSIKNSPWKNGKGDLVKELSQSCAAAGIKFGFYLAPWDQHEQSWGTNQYNDYFVNQLEELLTYYGQIMEIWFDGYGPIQQLDWTRYYAKVRELQPHALIAISGPDIRWIGNESGLGEKTEWCVKDPVKLFHGNATEKVWYPSECDVSIRPGWFWHQKEDNLVKTTEKLVDIYFKSVGQNSNLLLNVPPNAEGQISQYDISKLLDWKNRLNMIFSDDLAYKKNVTCSNTRGYAVRFDPNNCTDGNPDSFWATNDGVKSGWIIIDLGKQQTFNVIKIEEPILYGQRISQYKVEKFRNGSWIEISDGTTIGRTKIDLLNQPVTTGKVRLIIESALSSPAISSVSLYYGNI